RTKKWGLSSPASRAKKRSKNLCFPPLLHEFEQNRRVCSSRADRLEIAFSKFVERAEPFHAVEFFGLPIHSEFTHGQIIAGGEQQSLLRVRAQVLRGIGGE